MRMRAALTLGIGLAFLASACVAVHAKVEDGSVDVQAALDGKGMGQDETNLGDLVADAARQSADTDFAVIAADEVTDASLPAGSTPIRRIVGTLSYASDPTDTVVVLKLTGAQVMQVVERSVSRAPHAFDGFLQVSGLKVVYDPTKPEGSRVTLVTISGTPLDSAHSYTVATTRPVADGSFGYFRFWSQHDIVQDTHVSLASGLTTYLDAHRSLHVTVENRISP